MATAAADAGAGGDAGAATKKRALILVDVQNDFCEGGSLAVPKGDEVVPVLNKLREKIKWDLVVLTQDWHPTDHISFASNNEGANVMDLVDLPDIGKQVMWPDHCVQGSKGAEFHKDLKRDEADIVVQKGTNKKVDSYSGFGDAFDGKWEKTELADTLTTAGIEQVYVGGLASDFCVAFTCKDAAKNGFEVFFVEDAARGIAAESIAAEMEKMKAAGIKTVKSDDVE